MRKPVPKTARLIPERFRVARTTLWIDRLMTGVIISGGLLVIAAVLGIFVFIFAETLPLFGSASVEKKDSQALLSKSFDHESVFGLDRHGHHAFALENQRNIKTINLADASSTSLPIPLNEGELVSAFFYNPGCSTFAMATSTGRIGILPFDERGLSSGLASPLFFSLIEQGTFSGTIEQLSYSDAGDRKIIAAITQEDARPRVRILTLEQSRSLVGEGEIEPADYVDITTGIDGTPTRILTNMAGTGLVVATREGDVLYFEYDDDDGAWVKRQHINHPFDQDENINLIAWVFGEVSLVIGGDKGSVQIQSIYPQPDEKGTTRRLFGKTKDLEPLKGPALSFVGSHRNRLFIIGSTNEMNLYYSTSADTRQRIEALNFTPALLCSNTEMNALLAQDTQGGLHLFKIDDAFPEAGVTALFDKVWYEGYDKPAWQWQSVGGTDDYEPKLSLIPLIFGTVKGTFYALLFAVPVALLSAVYTAHFMHPRIKRIVKPIMEIMASLPSVVLGFFGALYLAPRMEDKVPALISMLVFIPLVTGCLGWFWMTRPIELRNKVRHGFEYLVIIPIMILVAWFSWTYLGDWLELPMIKAVQGILGLFGNVPQTATSFSDLWREGFNLPYEQRNSLVVGFIMGFAVIPIIFTIAEDALSNVPTSLLSGAEALGASRWQIVRTVVLPVASAGIFSALMIGLGRAVGETMIVLMATGNTPIMDWNIFNGMRTLSANIATELPEAAQHSTHYRILFLGGLILFMMTFVINTLAEFLRHRLRERFKVI